MSITTWHTLLTLFLAVLVLCYVFSHKKVFSGFKKSSHLVCSPCFLQIFICMISLAIDAYGISGSLQRLMTYQFSWRQFTSSNDPVNIVFCIHEILKCLQGLRKIGSLIFDF